MPTKEEILEHKTFKGEPFSITERVFHTLYEEDKSLTDGTVRALSRLIQCLHEKGIITEENIDSILLSALGMSDT